VRGGIPGTVAAVQLHLRGARPHVGVVEVRAAVVLRIPSLSRILRNLHPVILAILNLASVLESLCEELPKVIIVRSILEAQISDIRQILGEFLGETLTEILDSSCLLLLANLLIFLLVGGRLQSLPRKTTSKKVQEDMTKSFEIVSAGLLTAQMGVDTHVSCSSRKGLSLAVWDMLLRLRVTVLLGHAEVNHMDNAGSLGARAANEEVVGFDIAVNEILLVNGLNTRKHLLGNHDNRLNGEPSATVIEKILKGRTEQVDHENVVETLLAEVVNIGNTRAAHEDLISPVLISQLGSITLARFKLDSDLLIVK